MLSQNYSYLYLKNNFLIENIAHKIKYLCLGTDDFIYAILFTNSKFRNYALRSKHCSVQLMYFMVNLFVKTTIDSSMNNIKNLVQGDVKIFMFDLGFI